MMENWRSFFSQSEVLWTALALSIVFSAIFSGLTLTYMGFDLLGLDIIKQV
jgi:hypothetical protein